jgi:iron complex outermembrane receptor protein
LKKAFFSICVLLWFISIKAQPAECRFQLKGTIIDVHTRKGLDFATIHVLQTKKELLADEYGKFVLKNVCAGKITLHISHVGCEPEYYEMEISGDTIVTLFMHHTESELEEVIVQQHKTDVQATVDMVKLTAKTLEKLRGLTLGETLKNLPGMASLSSGTNISKPIIHGLQGNRIVIMNHGVRLEAQQWGNEHAPEIDPFLAQKITVVKGAQSIRYGSDALGGVILVEPNPLPATHGIGAEMNYVFHSNNIEHQLSGTIEGNHSKIPSWAWRVQGTYRRGGNALTPRYWLNNTGVEEGNMSAAMGWNKKRYGVEVFYSRFQTHIGILSSAHFGNVTDLQNAIARKNPDDSASFSYRLNVPRQFIVHHLGKVSMRLPTAEWGELRCVAAYQHNLRQEFDKHRAYNSLSTLKQIPGAEFAIQTISADLLWEHWQIKRFSGMLGASFMTQTNNQRYSSIMPPFWNFQAALFWIERWQFKQWEVEVGARVDYRWQQAYLPNERPSFTYIVPSGNVGVEYHFNEKIKWNIHLSTAWRAPNMVELFADGVHHGAASYDKGNRNLEPEISFNIASSFMASTAWINAYVSVYQNFIQRFIYIRPSLQVIETIRGAFPVFQYAQANVSLSGADIDIAIKPFRGFEILCKASLLRAWNRTAGEGLIWMPPQRFDNGLRYTFKQIKNLGNLYVGTSVVHVLRQTLAPPHQDFAEPPAGYWLWNAETGFDIRTSLPQPISLNLSANNLLNTAYREYLNRFRYFCDAPGVNVSLRVRVPLFLQKNYSLTNKNLSK